MLQMKTSHVVWCLCTIVTLLTACNSPQATPTSTRVELQNNGWVLAGDLLVPQAQGKVPAVLMLNEAAGNRAAYKRLANDLAERGIASLRLDLRGHGESTNLGTFVPGPDARLELISESHMDVIAARQYLQTLEAIDPNRIAVIGASYSGEEMMDAARATSYAQAYVALSPGSLSDESILSIDSTKIPWLYIASKDERYLKEVTIAVRDMSQLVEMLVIPGTQHATRILESRPDIAERIAVWLESKLKPLETAQENK